MMRRGLAMAAAALVLVLLSACNSNDNGGVITPSNDTPSTTAAP